MTKFTATFTAPKKRNPKIFQISETFQIDLDVAPITNESLYHATVSRGKKVPVDVLKRYIEAPHEINMRATRAKAFAFCDHAAFVDLA